VCLVAKIICTLEDKDRHKMLYYPLFYNYLEVTMKIAIEGLDGSGKTTVAKYISKFYNMKYVDKSFKYILSKYHEDTNLSNDEIRQYEKKICRTNDKLIKTLYYALGNIYDLRHEENNIVIDRYLGSNYFWNGDFETETIFSVLAKSSSNAVLTIILYASYNERVKRLKLRNPNDNDLNYDELQGEPYQKLIEFYKKYNLPFFVVHVDGKSISEVNQEVIQIIEGYKHETSI